MKTRYLFTVSILMTALFTTSVSMLTAALGMAMIQGCISRDNLRTLKLTGRKTIIRLPPQSLHDRTTPRLHDRKSDTYEQISPAVVILSKLAYHEIHYN